MKYTFGRNLFVTGSGKPMVFFINDCIKKDHLARYIEYGGGSVTDFPLGPYTVRLVDNDYSPPDGEDVFSCDFILNSCKRNTLSNLGRYRKGNKNNVNEDFDYNRILKRETTWYRAKDKHASVRSEEESMCVPSSSADTSANHDFRFRPLNPNPHESDLEPLHKTLHIFNNRTPVVVCEKLPDNPINSVTETSSRHLRMHLQQEKHHSPSESSCESVSESSDHDKKRSKPSRRAPFTDSERMKIVQYIIKTSSFHRVGGVELWKIMERRKVCSGRTWHSLKEHFRKKIMPHIDRYGLPAHVVEAFKNRTGPKWSKHMSHVQENSGRKNALLDSTKKVPTTLKSSDKKREKGCTHSDVSSSESESSQEAEKPRVKKFKKKLFTLLSTPQSSGVVTPVSVHRAGPSQLDLKVKNYSFHLQYKQRVAKQRAAIIKSISSLEMQNETQGKAVESSSGAVNATETSSQFMCRAGTGSEGQVAPLDAPDLTHTLALHNPEISSTSFHKPSCGNDDSTKSDCTQASNSRKVNKNENLCGASVKGSNSSPTYQRGITHNSSTGIDKSKKSQSPSKNNPSSLDLFSTPQECAKEDTAETDSEIIPSVVKQVTSSSQVMEPDTYFSPWTQCTPEEIIMEELFDDSGDNSNIIDEINEDPLHKETSDSDEKDAPHKENDQSSAPCNKNNQIEEKDAEQERSSGPVRSDVEHEEGVTHLKSHGMETQSSCSVIQQAASPASEKGLTIIEQATARQESFQDPCDWSDDGLHWRGNVYRLKKRSKVLAPISEKSVASMKAIHCVESTSKDGNPRNPLSPSCDVDSDAETWKCSVLEPKRLKEGQSQSLLDHKKASKGNLCCREESDCRSQFVQLWLQSTPQANVHSRVPDVYRDKVTEQEKPCAEDHNLRERALMDDDEVSYSNFNFHADLTVLSNSQQHNPTNDQEGQSHVIDKPNLPLLTIDKAVQTDPVQFFDPKVCQCLSSSSVLASQTKGRHTSSEDALLPSLCTSPAKVPTSTFSHSSAAVKSPRRPGTPNVVNESLSPIRTRSSPRGVSSPRSPRFLPL